jgi:hypothetical protein
VEDDMRNTFVVVTVLAVLAGCGRSPGPEGTLPPPTVNAVQQVPDATAFDCPAIGLRMAAVPEQFRVISNDQTVSLARGASDNVWLELRRLPGNVPEDLEGAARRWRQQVPTLAGGRFVEQRGTDGPFGPALLTVSSFSGDPEPGSPDGVSYKVLTLFTAHPSGQDLLEVAYHFPSSWDEAEIEQELMGLLARLEAI